MNSSKCLMISNCLFDTFLEVCPDTRISSLCYICDMEKFCAYVKYLTVITLGQNAKFSILGWKYDTGQKLLENILSNQKTITKWHTLQYQKRHSKKQFSVCVVGLGKIRSYQLYVCQSFFFLLLHSGKILYSGCLKWEKSGSSLIKTFKLLSWR